MSYDRWSTSVTDHGAALAELRLEEARLGGAPILGALSLSVRAGDTLALRGPSGVGKTTLLRVLAGLESGFRGTRRVTDKTALVFQEPTLLPWRSALQNLTLVTGCSENTARALLEEVGLAEKADAFPGQLSLGQQRRLSLARALAAEPELLLLDEPFVSLDPGLVDEMMALFGAVQRRRHVAAILVTHAEAEARALATRIVTLGGTPARIVSDVPNKPIF